ncbi:Imm32 family immunity protein [Actinoplanes regularis]|uniref:Uncharacterized protein n=1 Tax=Actinoplanes regularis TaxID=52697 RepID=A0A238V0V5_9ACTN|nr:hypothetical protein [Actinoplanes regularis]GIE84074.1 hypothetical protein Are01nite_05540 [Actinoplanes regularis]SNR28172.1 hypothetical protein SAMN06264365_101514 [Actinoplanes regularis]
MRVSVGDKTGEIELCGTSSELAGLAERLLSGEGSVALATEGDPSPYSRFLSSLRFVPEAAPVVIRWIVESDSLEIRGGGAHLELFASNLKDFAEEAAPSDHTHVEYCDRGYLAEESEALVVTFCD